MTMRDRRQRILITCVWISAYIHGCLTEFSSTDHPRHHRHEKSRLRRQQNSEPSVFYLEPDDPNLPPGQSPAEFGDWGPWSAPSECSRTCGGGVQSQTRECSPYSNCRGSKTRYFSCNIQDCPEGTDFRAEQCAAYNDIQYEGLKYEWIPYNHAENHCALNCMPKRERYYYRHKDAVIDGTPCNEDNFDVCVQGKCLPVGCDKLLGSTAKEDSCRVCGGDGSTCTKKSGLIETNALVPGYMDLFLIPANATNIRIQEKRASNNYLAVRNQENHFYLNGDWTINNSGVMKFAGTKFHYSRKPFPHYAPEVITALGPTTEALYIALLYQEPNPGIEYVYSLPVGSVRESPKQGYSWRTEPFSECNVTCGGGIQTRKVWCAYGSEQVGSGLCDPASEPAASKLCGESPCPAEWVTDNWSRCSAPCGELGYQTRQVNCLQAVGFTRVPVTEHLCRGVKPESSRQCQEKGPCPVWHVGPWKPCDKLCGEGKQTRDVICYKKVDGVVEILPDSHCLDEKPVTEQSCMLRPCAGLDWITTEWSGCRDKCGLAIETRLVRCADEKGNTYNESLCHSYRKPESVKNCTYVPCTNQWFASQWSACSAKCGAGIQTRIVICGSLEGDKLTKVDVASCDSKLKPEDKIDCRAEQDCKGEWFVSPFGPCSKSCGGGIQERIILCLRDNKTVSSSECSDEDFISGNTKECNNEPCGKDELMPVSTAQVITEEESEECDYDYDYEETTESEEDIFTKDGLFTTSLGVSIVSEDEGSGGYSDDIITVSSASSSSSESYAVSSDTTESSGISSAAGASSEAADLITGKSSAMPDSSDTMADEPTGGSTAGSTAGEISGTGETGVTVEVSEAATASPGGSGSSELPTESASTGLPSASSLSTEGSSTESSVSASDSTSSELANTESSVESSSILPQSTTSDVSETSSDSSSDEPTTIASTDSSVESSSVAASEAFSTSSESTSSALEVSEQSESSAVTLDVGTTESSDAATAITSLDSSSAGASAIEDAITSSPEASSIGSTDKSLASTDRSVSAEGSSELPGSSEAGVTEGLSGTSEVSEARASEWSTAAGSSESVTDSSSVSGDATTESSDGTSASSSAESSSDFTDQTSASFSYSPSSLLKEALTTEAKKMCKPRTGPKKCVNSAFGCCPDGKTVAKGPFSKGCPMPKTCKEAPHGCCPDGVSPAKGPKGRGCPKSMCSKTLFGCCPDEVTPSNGNNYEGCPITTTPMPDCNITKFGCCPDGKPAAGLYFEGCQETCSKTEFGCCPDGFTVKTGVEYEGCDIPNNETCANSTHGCCPDGLSVAEGPDDEGCKNCTESRFGCCPDGILAAKGLRQFGCAPACTTSDFGCCSDNKTLAHGPNQEGCCLNTPFGCCQDNIVPANGPNYHGCDCRNSAFGCCPDGKTSATGSGNEGCGCQFSEFGCCPDRQAQAEGPNYEGCPCHTYQFGCCPDGVTIAKGPGQDGCGCENSAYGCCPDGKTPKLGADRNCTCEATKFGCCPDGVGTAQGDRFEGCENIPVTGEVCSLPRDNGDCRQFKIYHWFDNSYGGCARFWYGGCGGNQNRFKTVEECKNVCVHPTGRDVCSLPVSKGSCRNNFPMWYYDSTYRQCRPFSWTGCLGNSNRFHTREECELQCGSQEHLDPCEQTLEHGPCNGTFERWYYNKEERDCIPFTYGGCKGTKNNFLTQAACKSKCMKPDEQKPECSLHKAAGTCTEKVPKWFFEPKEKRCMPFYYSGCGGNGNHFDSLEECNAHCPVHKEKDVCVLPSAVGECSTYSLRWYFNSIDGKCKQFYWGGCGGNKNNFLTERECLRRCEKIPEPQESFSEDMCRFRPERGSCDGSVQQFYYDSADGTCKVFEYSGCDGNGNRFDNEEECLQSCGRTQDPCSLPKVTGPCDRFVPQWYYDRGTSNCRQFYYSGCSGNANRFSTVEECRSTCVPNSVDTPPENEIDQRPRIPPERQPEPAPAIPDEGDICYFRVDPGPCNEEIPAWYYDPSQEKCTQFAYGGCGGNANRFLSEEQCERQCGVFKSQDACIDDVEEGTCSSTIPKYYFDRMENECREFTYSGCGGNPNRFSTIAECNSLCHNFTEPRIPQGADQEETNKAICHLPLESGTCEALLKRFYYDPNRRTCVSFVYSGCGGNLNNFLNLDECSRTCIGSSRAPDVPQPDESDPNAIDVGERPGKNYCPQIDEECANLRCSYGLEKWVDSNGCEQCRCHDPCAQSSCAASGTRCVVRLVPERSGNVYRGFCEGQERPQEKPGQCPEIPESETNCASDCEKDLDCPGSGKCCYNGCANVCTDIQPERAPEPAAEESAPYISEDTDQMIEGEEGNLVRLHCIAYGAPPPTVSWRKNGEMLSPISGSKYRIYLNGTLEIILLREDDADIYTCEASNGIDPMATRDYTLNVNPGKPLPVEVVNNEEDTNVVVTLGSPATMRCYAIGFPVPAISWFRGTTLLPVADQEFQQRRDNSLYIRAVTLTNLGFYTCQVYNGQGRPASQTLVLKAFGPITADDPNDVTYNKFLVPSLAVSSSDKFRPPPVPPPEPQPNAPLRFAINSSNHHVKAGSNITLTCNLLSDKSDVDVMFSWLKDEGTVGPITDRIILQDNQLIIVNADEQDSGNYTCIYEYDGIDRATDSIAVVVQKTLLHSECVDHPALANCSLIVNARYCVHKYYAKFCCKSCTEAGQLAVHVPGAPPPWETIGSNRDFPTKLMKS